MARDPRSAERIARCRREVERAERLAALHVKKLVEGQHPDSALPWKDASIQTRASMELVKGIQASARAELKAANEGPRSPGVVFVVPQMASAEAWRASTAAIKAGNAVIDVQAIEPVPAAKEPA